MDAWARLLAIVAGLAIVAPLGVHVLFAWRAAAAKRQARTACPFEDDDHDSLPLARTTQLVVAESLLWLYTAISAPFPPAETSPGAPDTAPVVVLPPPWLPRAAVRLLAARLRADGFPVVCPRLGPLPHDRNERTTRLDRALRATWEREGARQIDVIASAGTADVVVAHLAAGGSGTPVVRRLITLGATGATGPRVPVSTEVIAIYSQDDPLLGPVDQARRSEAFNVAVRGVGRLGLLHAPHVYALVREHLNAPASAHVPAWSSIGSS